MLGDSDAIATVAVRDLEAARRFYEGKLRLKPADEQEPGTMTYVTGRSKLFVYPSQYAGTNKATAVTFAVGEEFDSLVHELAGRGVVFEHYDLPDTMRQGDVHIAGDLKVAWFKDPDGNVISIANG